MYLYGKIKFNEACHKRIGSGFSTRPDTNKAVQPQEMTDRGPFEFLGGGGGGAWVYFW